MTAPEPWDSSFESVLRPLLRSLPHDAPLAPETNLAAVGLDSMASVELLLKLEETYAIEVPDAMLQPATFATPLSLWQAVSSLCGPEHSR